MITTEFKLAVVGGIGVLVEVGSAVCVDVTVGAARVSVCVPVGRGVSVGNGLGAKNVEVGNGVKVGKSKSNNAVGVVAVPSLVGTPGLGRTLGLR